MNALIRNINMTFVILFIILIIIYLIFLTKKIKPIFLTYQLGSMCTTYSKGNCNGENSSKTFGRMNFDKLGPNIEGSLLFLTSSFQGRMSENYWIVASKNNKTIGSLSWLCNYKQNVDPQEPYKTTIPSLTSPILCASGIFAPYNNGIIKVDYTKDPRKIKISI